MAESDWDTVTVLRKKGPTAAQAKSKQAILAAQRRGEDVETSKKWAAGQNKQHSITKNTAKLDRETEELHHDRVTLEVGKVIQQGRQSKGLTQKDLATKINEKPQVIADYESGRAIPNNQVLGKIERAIVPVSPCCWPWFSEPEHSGPGPISMGPEASSAEDS
uniref:Endothelial differentiation-related factor 1 n=1 Tax=Papio anubis TaxID=9555 RepID=A0A096NRQ8_PAPAN